MWQRCLTSGDEVLLQGEGDGGLAGAGQAGEPDGAPAELVALRGRGGETVYVESVHAHPQKNPVGVKRKSCWR